MIQSNPKSKSQNESYKRRASLAALVDSEVLRFKKEAVRIHRQTTIRKRWQQREMSTEWSLVNQMGTSGNLST